MITELTDTSTAEISAEIVRQRESSGTLALGKVLTLVIAVAPLPGETADADAAVRVANDASHENPCRVIVIRACHDSPTGECIDGATRLDAEIRIGGRAGASEVVMLTCHGELIDENTHSGLVVPLLLPDTPVVVWWPFAAPADVSASTIGTLAHRRITDMARAGGTAEDTLAALRETYVDGDTDLSWTRLTPWRQQLAATLDLAPYEPVERATIRGQANSLSVALLASWLRKCLKIEVEVSAVPDGDSCGLSQVQLHRASGPITVTRVSGSKAELDQPGLRRRQISMPTHDDAACLVEELNRLDRDAFYGEVLRHG